MGLHRLRTIRQAAAETVFSENSYRWLIFNADTNGFGRCIRRVGRRIYVDLDSLEEWIDEQSGVSAGSKRATR